MEACGGGVFKDTAEAGYKKNKKVLHRACLCLNLFLYLSIQTTKRYSYGKFRDTYRQTASKVNRSVQRANRDRQTGQQVS